nr:cytochrome oxidase subunit II [Moniligastridae sp. SC201762-01]
MPYWGQVFFQDAASTVMLQFLSLHDHALLILVLILSTISYLMVFVLSAKYTTRFASEVHLLEVLWTLTPGVVLLFLALPSMFLLYTTDESPNISMTIKITGHQWYWSYEYTDFVGVEMDSYMLPTMDLNIGDYRLLEVDNRLVIPSLLEIRLLISAADVIHAWTIPSIGVKVDAVPGRLNQVMLMTARPGIFYGQCSEICGANHSFMPIALESINTKSFVDWVVAYSN